MGFWSGFEGLTGHRPGAFKGFSLKDILDKDMWERRERLGGRQSRQFEETGVVPTTAWYRGMGRPEMMGPEVGAAGTEVKENLLSTNPDMYAGVNQRRFDATTLANQQRRNALWGSGPSVAHVRAARPWPNIQAQMLSDPRQGVSGMRIPPAELMGRQPPPAFSSPMRPEGAITGPRPRQFQMSDMTIPPADLGMITRREAVQRVVPPTPPGVTDEFKFGQWVPVNNQADEKTVIQNFADPSKPNKITTTFETKEQPQPQPTSIMNMFNIDAWRDLARRKWEERMRARGGY